MLDQPFHAGGRNIGGTIPKDYEFISDSQSDQDVDGKAVQPSSNNWDEADGYEVRDNEAIYKDEYCNRGCEEVVHVTQKLIEDNVTDKDCEMPQNQKVMLDKGDSKMDSDFGILIKQKEKSTDSGVYRHTVVSLRDNGKTSNRCSDKLSIDEDWEATVGFPQEPHHRCSMSKDVDFSDFSDVATSDTNEEIKSQIENSLLWEGEKSGDNNSPEKKLSFTSPVMDCSLNYVNMNGINSDIEEPETDGDMVVLRSKNFQNQRDKNCISVLDDYLQTPNGSDVKMKADQNDDKKESLLLLEDSSVDDMSLELPSHSDSLAEEDQQKQAVSGSGSDREVMVSSMDSDILPLNDFDSPDDLYPVQASLYDSSQPMQDSSQSALSSAASVSFCDSMSQESKASDIADSSGCLANTDSGYFSACDLIETSSAFSIQPDDSSEQQVINYPERQTAARRHKLKFGGLSSAAAVKLSSSLQLSSVGSSTSENQYPGNETCLNKCEGNAVSKHQSLDHPLSSGEKQKSPHSHYPASPDASAADTLEIERNRSALLDTGTCTAREINNTLPSLAQATASLPSCSYDSHEPVTDSRHIKSIFNTYVNHRLKTDVCNDGINDIADELALVLKGSRKRPAINTDASTIPVKKPNLVETNSTSNSKDSMKVSGMDMSKDDSSCAWLRVKVKTTVQKQDAALVMCNICDTSSPYARTCQCKNAHVICQSCLEDQVRLVMASDKVELSCPEMSCSAAISLDSLSLVLPSLVVDILSDNLRLKAQKATVKAMKKMQELVICPRCTCPGMLDEGTVQFVCATCNSHCCRYCKAAWSHYEEHDGCYLLSFVGADCLKDITKLPRNWDTHLTPFNKNYLQVNVPLNSTEGSTVAAYFAKTASSGASVVQVFRIQNRKLWEKYVLKRKHVEEEIGVAELKEKFLFHGTRAENIVSICSEGFDIRVPTANGAVLGKGIYFSATAKYSEKYTDNSNMMYLTRVICGWSQQGEKLMTRPSYHSSVRRMYDSCVNNIKSPTIFTVFDNSQCYPEYLIQFAY